MEIKKVQDGECLTVILKGSLDPNTSPELMDDLTKNVDFEKVKELIFDFKDVDYIFSVGLRVFLQIQKIVSSYDNKMKIINASDSIKQIFDVVGFSKIITLE